MGDGKADRWAVLRAISARMPGLETRGLGVGRENVTAPAVIIFRGARESTNFGCAEHPERGGLNILGIAAIGRVAVLAFAASEVRMRARRLS